MPAKWTNRTRSALRPYLPAGLVDDEGSDLEGEGGADVRRGGHDAHRLGLVLSRHAPAKERVDGREGDALAQSQDHPHCQAPAKTFGC
eukprot:1182394-Prorocentrum_minimum.AAC.2